jgi:hypothetical protein
VREVDVDHNANHDANQTLFDDEHASRGGDRTAHARSGGWARAKRVAGFGIPLWVVVVVLVLLISAFTTVWLRRDTAELGPAVPDARRVEMNLLVCNETVDARGYDVRKQELALQRLLTEDQGVANAKVRIERQDCGKNAPK